jgi:hypothetical protein
MDKQISLVVTQEAEFSDISRNLTDMMLMNPEEVWKGLKRIRR